MSTEIYANRCCIDFLLLLDFLLYCVNFYIRLPKQQLEMYLIRDSVPMSFQFYKTGQVGLD